MQSYRLACDAQTDGQTYCSQACRLKEHAQRSLSFAPKSDPETNASLASFTISAPIMARRTRPQQFYPAPAYDFDEHRRRKQPTASRRVEKDLEHDRRLSPHSNSGNSNSQLAGSHCWQRCLLRCTLFNDSEQLNVALMKEQVLLQ